MLQEFLLMIVRFDDTEYVYGLFMNISSNVKSMDREFLDDLFGQVMTFWD